MRASFAGVGATVVDISNPHRITLGTVTATRGGMYSNTIVEVFWHHLGYTNWERPQDLYVVHTEGRELSITEAS